MKRWEFKQAINLRWLILKLNAVFSFKEATAYVYNNWGGLASTLSYMVTYLVFLSIIFSRVKTIAGYDYSEMLFFTFVAQIGFYITFTWSLGNIRQMGRDVNSGKLDLILVKPLPALWYVSFQKVNLLTFIIEGLPALIPLLYLLVKNWSFSISFGGFVLGMISFILGQTIVHCFQFIFGLIAFWTGSNKGMVNLAYKMTDFGESIPLEAYPKSAMVVGLTLVPFLIQVGLTVSYMLGYTTNPAWLLLVFLVAVIFLWSKIKLWDVSLRRYSSASS